MEQLVRSACLVRIETDTPGPTKAVYLVYHRELRKVPRIRAVVAALETYLRGYG